MRMQILDIITKKKLGQPLTREEITFFARGAADKTVPDYQLAALLMAIRLNGMTAQETTDLTLAMRDSGDVCDLLGDPGDIALHERGRRADGFDPHARMGAAHAVADILQRDFVDPAGGVASEPDQFLPAGIEFPDRLHHAGFAASGFGTHLEM